MRSVGLFAVGHDTAAAKVQDHTEDIWLGLQVIHDQITAHAFSNGTKIQGTAIKKGYIVSVHLNFLVAHFGKKSVNFGLVRDMRILAVNVPQADDLSKGGVKSTVGILGKLADFLKVGARSSETSMVLPSALFSWEIWEFSSVQERRVVSISRSFSPILGIDVRA